MTLEELQSAKDVLELKIEQILKQEFDAFQKQTGVLVDDIYIRMRRRPLEYGMWNKPQKEIVNVEVTFAFRNMRIR